MRIILAGPPKTGNVWIENIIASIYDLEILRPPDVPDGNDESFREFVGNGLFKSRSIFHQHFLPTSDFLSITSSIRCHIISAIRSPYDTFVSLYFYIQQFKEDYIAAGDPGIIAIGKPIDHPDVRFLLKHNFRENLVMGVEWIDSGKSLVVRYEDLHDDPLGTMRRITDKIAPVDTTRIWDAIRACDSQILRAKDENFAQHIRVGRVGDWRNHLHEAHLEIFRTHHSDLIERLGYDVL